MKKINDQSHDNMSIVDRIVLLIKNGEFVEAETIFKSNVFVYRDLAYYACLQKDFRDYITKYAEFEFGSSKGYIANFDLYTQLNPQQRFYKQVVLDSRLLIKNGLNNNAQRDLLAVGNFLMSNDLIYKEFVSSYYSLFLLIVSSMRQSQNVISYEYEKSLKEFIVNLHDIDNEKFNELRKVIFRDFKSLIQRKFSEINDGQSVFDNELLPYNKKVKEKNIDLDIAICDFNKRLGGLIGIEHIKNEINSLISFAKINSIKKLRGFKTPSVTMHLVFVGNPGTGKTTVARLLAELYFKLGLLSKGHFIETDRSMLVGEYVGHTAVKTKKVLEKAVGGVLFIDEAYTLIKGGETDFGIESIDTILKFMEDNRDDLIVIVAGYPELMLKFLNSNPGLKSRFSTTLYFEDFSNHDLVEIFKLFATESEFTVDERLISLLVKKFEELKLASDFSNARTVRNIFDQVIKKHAIRVGAKDNITDNDLTRLLENDYPD